MFHTYILHKNRIVFTKSSFPHFILMGHELMNVHSCRQTNLPLTVHYEMHSSELHYWRGNFIIEGKRLFPKIELR